MSKTISQQPPRTSHPAVKFSCTDCEPMVIDKLPFDKYELEPSPLTQYILERKSPHTCWQVFVSNSGKYSDLGHPFGYLKASTTLTCVNLFVMPYNYPVLLPLLDDLFKVHKLKPNLKWRQSFDNYLKTVPPYFLMPLKKALRMMGAPNLISETLDCGLSYSVISYLKKLSQQSKMEADRIIGLVGKKVPQETSIKVKNQTGGLSLAHRKDFKQLLQGITGETPLRLNEINVKEFAGFQIALLNKDLKPQTYRNAYDIPRQNLLDQLTRMRVNLLKTQKMIRGLDDDCVHSIPIVQMGNYQEYLKSLPSPLREIDPDQPKRLHTFGNPFKQDKKGMMIDEADEIVTGPQNKTKRPGESNSPASVKRRRSMSPLLRRPQTPPIITNHIGGKGPPQASGTQVNSNLIKPIPLHKDTNNILLPDGTEEKKPENWQSLDKQIDGLSEGTSVLPVLSDDMMQTDLTFLPETVNCIEEDGLDHKPVMNALTNTPLENCTESDEEKTVDVESSSLISVPNSVRDVQILEGCIADLKVKVMKEVRKPGRNYERIFHLLEEVQGPPVVQRNFIEFTIKEAARFKRRVLIQQLERLLETMNSDTPPFKVNHVNSR
ncbi:integrator complex subunit 6-like [Protopterus annectens]|uniref:integrator complex subunit 6-like n=1 Tax=Protopterus annectens TaxID=7888 RepID=UPI001CFC04E9|nr:integrator complex subunit 6-like [Protopterus annectens]